MNPWIPHLLRAGGGGGGPVLPPAGRTMLANLKSSLILDEGTGDPTWSRATKAWGFNELGYLEELASGCAFFGGARLVRNTVRTTSEDFSNAAWIKFGSITAPSANIIVCANATSAQYINQGGGSLIPGQKLSYCIRAKKVVGGVDFIQIAGQSTTHGTGQFVNISLVDGTYSATGCFPVVTSLGGGVYDISVVLTCVAAGFDVYNIAFTNALSSTRLEAFVGDGIKSFELLRAWSVDVTNYNASYVPEYVSVGVASAPFPSGIDGAKYFETDWQGAPLPAASLIKFRREASAINNLLYSRDFLSGAKAGKWIPSTMGSAVFSDDFSTYADTAAMLAAGWTASGAGVLTLESAKIRIAVGTNAIAPAASRSFTTVVGKQYTVTATLSTDATSAATFFIGFGSSNGTVGLSLTSGTAVGTYTCTFVATGTTTWITITTSAAGTIAGEYTEWDDLLLKESAVTCSLTATGLDGIANTATTLTATAADAIILQPITLASAARCASAYVKRRTGTGTISFTQDGGSTWTDITSQINSSTWSRVQITATLANPSVGFKISTLGDAIDVDCVQNEAGAEATSPIVTTTATITRNADSLAYQTASNWSDTAGTAYIEAQPWQWSVGGLVGSATNGLLESASNSGATAYDGTNAANGPAGSPSGRKKLALRWTGATMDVSVGGVIGTAGTYDGAMGLSSLGIAVNSSGYFGPVAVWNYAMTDDEFKALTT